MPQGNVTVRRLDGQIRTTPTVVNDKVCGLLFDISGRTDFWTTGAGTTLAPKWKDKIIELNNLDDAIEAGIVPYTGNATTDVLSGVPYYHIRQFFEVAGGTGRLFVMFANCSTDWSAIIDMQRASTGIISQFGVWTEQLLWNKMDDDATTYTVDIVSSLEGIAEQLADDYYAPASILLNANTSKVKTSGGESKEIVFSQIPKVIANAPYVSVLLGQAIYFDEENKWRNVQEMQGSMTATTPVGNIGVALGVLTQCGVGESIGWVGRFDIAAFVPAIEMGFGNSTITDNRLTNSTKYSALTQYQLDELDDKGYIYLCTYVGQEGATFFNKDRTCSNGDFCTIARNRAINKSRRLVRNALLPYVNSPISVDPANGNLSAAQIATFKNLITNTLDVMVTNGDIQAIGAVNVPAAQNILVNKRLQMSYSIIPKGCAETIAVDESLAIKS